MFCVLGRFDSLLARCFANTIDRQTLQVVKVTLRALVAA